MIREANLNRQGIDYIIKGNRREKDKMINKKSRPRELKPSVKQLIYYRALTQRMVPREFLANELIKEIEEIGEIAPTLETTKRYISRARNADNPLDKPWSIACCSEYSGFFPPDSIPVLMNYKQWIHGLSKVSKEAHDRYNEYTNLFGVTMSDISIRHAIWIIRLKPLVEKTFADKMENDENIRFGYPFFIAMVYEIAETTCEILNEHFITTGLDNALAAGDLDTLARIGGLGLLAASKPANCNGDCESCKYMRIPGSIKLCMPRPKKEGVK